jgi:predicted RNA-binding Zn-ribbon protein involved in translation (DUF1610 family)
MGVLVDPGFETETFANMERIMSAISRGICISCGKECPKNGMTKHTATCEHRKSGRESHLHLLVQGLYQPEYWLHVEAQPKARLDDLDMFLRHIWLECCGHMSSFEINGQLYVSVRTYDSEERTMSAELGKVLIPGVKIKHTYDFGTPTELSLRVVGELPGASTKEKIRLLARNLAPQFECADCGKPATQLCSQCSWECDAWFCDDCASEHECGEEMLLPIVNSPRVGQCGYTG